MRCEIEPALEIGTRVRFEVLPEKRRIGARVVSCMSLGQYENFWFLALALDAPGNVWGIEKPPEDWNTPSNPFDEEQA